MKHTLRTPLLGLLMLTLPLGACAEQAAPPAASAPVATATIAQSSAPQIVTGLPDFTRLVEQVGPGVVNVEAKVSQKLARNAQQPDLDQMPEFFRRFFGPEFQQPDGPQERRGTSLGSGFVISPDGYVLTNHHVVDGADEVTVKLSDRREFKAKVIGSDEQYDVALLKIDGNNLPSIRLGNSDTLKPGQWVVAIGSPLGLDHSVTAGIVSAVGRTTSAEQRYVPFIQTDVAINRGNSGGPLLNTSGEVVGINSQIFSMSGGYMGISFAIPIDLAMSAVEQLKATGKVSRGQIGVVIRPVAADDAKGFGLPDTRGALVRDLVENGAGEKAGLERGDVIRSVNGKAIETAGELPPMIGAMAPGSKVKLDILRDGKPRQITVTLDELESDAATPERDDSAQDEGGSRQTAKSDLLGLSVADLDSATRKQLGLASGEGIRITGVDGDSAREARLGPGVLILQVGRTKVGSVAAFEKALSGVRPGDVVMLLVRDSRGGPTQFVAVTAGED
ncbi:peptidase S1 [Pseudoxanthomonas kalamensis DSM 18571]|uniref:DegQ family serine endoprotease n=1 Tax=Pseudoxanthomonas kalamensis TaxID=289483 RepID=UPI001390A0DA|nr:DegQ family serine endoprotease [Pseudoxanthomonas kalamensis]KAF1710057.1 peptidase S1 [Pseudoxanthomonas kalamensis DSM 18571]